MMRIVLKLWNALNREVFHSLHSADSQAGEVCALYFLHLTESSGFEGLHCYHAGEGRWQECGHFVPIVRKQAGEGCCPSQFPESLRVHWVEPPPLRVTSLLR